VSTDEMNFVDRTQDLEALIDRIQMHTEGVAYVNPGAVSGKE
jgi:hypothetical protein